MQITTVTESYSVAPQIQPGQLGALAEAGFTAVICNRPDNEEPGQPTAAEIAAVCQDFGLIFAHIPISGMPVPADDVDQQRRIIADSSGPVLGYCRSGQRSLLIWQASA